MDIRRTANEQFYSRRIKLQANKLTLLPTTATYNYLLKLTFEKKSAILELGRPKGHKEKSLRQFEGSLRVTIFPAFSSCFLLQF